MTSRTRLTVLEGGRDKHVFINGLTVQVISDSLPALPVDVRVFEEDTFLVLTVDPVMRYKEEHPIRLMTKVAESKPNKPGSVIVNNSSWYAVIHDVDQDPTWKEKRIKKAYQQILLLAELKKVKRIGSPLLGSVHGSFDPGRSLEMFLGSINSTPFQFLQNISILVPHSSTNHIWKELKKQVTAQRA